MFVLTQSGDKEI